MSKEIRDIFTDIGIAAVVLVIALPLLYKGGCEPKSEPKSDTIYVHDTIRIVEPIHIKETIVRHDTVFFPIYNELESTSNPTSNLTSNLTQDSAKVVIPITERTYEDSTYKAVVRGYNPELVSLDIYNTTKYYPVVEKVKIKPKVVISAGLYGGFGSKGADYGLGIMVGVPIWSW
jgi:hypothetical protein